MTLAKHLWVTVFMKCSLDKITMNTHAREQY